MSRRKTYHNLSKMSDQEITDLMDSISSAEDTGDESNGDFDNDDDLADPDYLCPAEEFEDLLADDCSYDTNSIGVVDAIHASLNLGDSEQQIDVQPIAASSPIPSTFAQLIDNQHSNREGEYLFVVCFFVAVKMYRHFFRCYSAYC